MTPTFIEMNTKWIGYVVQENFVVDMPPLSLLLAAEHLRRADITSTPPVPSE